MFPIYTPWKHQETFGFQWDHLPEMGWKIEKT